MKNLFLYGILFTLLAASGCRKDCVDPADPECSNYDPCTGYEPADAGFSISMRRYGWHCGEEERQDVEFEIDTIYGTGGAVYFKALQRADRYEWRIGADSRVWTVKEFSLGFGEAAVGDVPITLIAEKTDVRLCSGEAFTRDTLTKVLHVKRFSLDAYLSNPIFGRWQGHNEDEPDKLFEIEIQPAGGGVGINGLLPDCVDIDMNDAGMLFRHFWFDTGRRECRRMCGIGVLQKDSQALTIDYNYDLDFDNAPGKRVERRFVGKKIE